jgi:hypothetical protein
MARIRQPSINGAQTILQVDFLSPMLNVSMQILPLQTSHLTGGRRRIWKEHDEIDMGVAKEVDGEFGNKAGLRSK